MYRTSSRLWKRIEPRNIISLRPFVRKFPFFLIFWFFAVPRWKYIAKSFGGRRRRCVRSTDGARLSKVRNVSSYRRSSTGGTPSSVKVFRNLFCSVFNVTIVHGSFSSVSSCKNLFVRLERIKTFYFLVGSYRDFFFFFLQLLINNER